MQEELRAELEYLQTILSRIDPEGAAWVAALIPLAESNSDLLWRKLNDRRLWGGAGAIANQPLQPPSALDPWQWREDIRQFRETMIRLGEMLRKRGGENPDIQAWLLAFHNWNSVGA